MSVEVIRMSNDRLSDQVWTFYINAGSDTVTLKLSSYLIRERPTTRHKMKMIARWSYFDQRSYYSSIAARDVPMPDDVRADAVKALKIEVAGP